MNCNKKILEVKNLSVSLSDKLIFKDVNFDVNEGEWLVLSGNNGEGKTTLLKAIAGLIKYDGCIKLFNKNINKYSFINKAKNLGFVFQNLNIFYDFTVKEFVAMGRYPYKKGILKNTNKDENEIVDHAINLFDLRELQNKYITAISGGELQRTYFAQLYAQNPKLLLLDEPLNNLDEINQTKFLNIIKNWITEKNISVISVMHNKLISKKYANKTLNIKSGKAYLLY